MDPAAIGQRVRRMRRALGLSQAELADRAGISRQALGTLEAGRHLPRVDAAVALAGVLGTTVEDLLAVGPPRALHVLGDALADGQAVRVVQVGDHHVCIPTPGTDDGEVWSAPDAVIDDRRVALLPGADTDGFLVAGCDPSLGIVAALGPERGNGRIVPVLASSSAARLALVTGRAHAAVVHDVQVAGPQHPTSVHRLPLAAWRTGLAVPQGAEAALAAAVAGEGPVVQRDAGAAAQAAYERALLAEGRPCPDGPLATGHLDAARQASVGGIAAVTIEPVALAAGMVFHALETHRVEVWIDARSADHPGAVALGELLASARLRRRLAILPGYALEAA
ncbi:helix-turn-helix transcriptional regulator [Egicoccus sp. AB-alg6-2]|uniref:helix-turn-helix transcriptional regulator n=1 Tax=Egicoccus sp. AB-alg6-2 TaxID=3242692 RepID=UPI00359CD99C